MIAVGMPRFPMVEPMDATDTAQISAATSEISSSLWPSLSLRLLPHSKLSPGRMVHFLCLRVSAISCQYL